MSSTREKITHVLFDFDGTLVNTIDPMIEAAMEMIAEADDGRMVTAISSQTKFRMANIACFNDLFIIIDELFKAAGCRWTYSLQEFRNEFQHRWLAKDFQLMPGVETVVKHFHRCGIPMAIATGNSKHFYQGIMAKFGSFFIRYFQHCVSAVDDPSVSDGKPNPLVYHVAMSRFVPPSGHVEQVLIFEDSVVGIRGAVATGAQTVWVHPNFHTIAEHKPLAKMATVCLSTLEQFDPVQFGLEPIRR